MKKLFKFIPLLSFFILFPFIAFAQSPGIGGFIAKIQGILSSILPVLISFGVVYFIWGIVQYVIADGEEAKKTGKDRMIYGIIGLAVIVGMWGLVNIITTTFGLSASAPTGINVNGTAGSGCSIGTTFSGWLGFITCIINSSLIPLLFAVATVMFIWGALKFFIINADEEAKRAEGRQFMVWGVIALAVMLSVWGLVGIFGSTFGINSSVLPQVRPPGSSYPSGPCADGTYNC